MTFTPSKDPKEMTPQERRSMLADALESGEYEQTQGSLRDDQGLCCLGVGCDLYGQFAGDEMAAWQDDSEFLCSPANGDPERDEDGHPFYDSNDGEMPERVWRWFGFGDGAGTLDGLPYGARSLVILNDGATEGSIAAEHATAPFSGKTFPEIAAVIRERYL